MYYIYSMFGDGVNFAAYFSVLSGRLHLSTEWNHEF